jgi:6-phosphogluconate dehydrogenase
VKLAMIGLGRMGGNMTQRLLRAGHEVVVFDLNDDARRTAVEAGATAVASLAELNAALAPPRAVWVMVPAGEPTRATIDELVSILEAGDVIIDGGNSNFRDSMATGTRLKEAGIDYVDAGVSGGVWGLAEGYCLMVGGTDRAIDIMRPAFESLAPENGFAHVGPSGSGHFVKMVHNGIEYGLMQAFAEGFELMEASREFDLDLHQIAEVWRYGSVVRSWLLDLTARALKDGESFDKIRGYVDDSGEGRWTVEESIRTAVPLPAITASLFARFASRQDESFAAKVTAALRNQFGGHAVKLESGESSGTSGAPKAQ